MQFYLYDFSEYIQFDVEPNGQFAPYPYLNDYWVDVKDKFPYVIKKDDKYVGFVLVKRIVSENSMKFSIAEFFVLKKYRRSGVGKSIAFSVFNLHKGHWEVYQKASNTPAQLFWRKVIEEYTNEQFKERIEGGKRIQEFENSDK